MADRHTALFPCFKAGKPELEYTELKVLQTSDGNSLTSARQGEIKGVELTDSPIRWCRAEQLLPAREIIDAGSRLAASPAMQCIFNELKRRCRVP